LVHFTILELRPWLSLDPFSCDFLLSGGSVTPFILVSCAGASWPKWGRSDSVYCFFDVSAFKTRFGRTWGTDIDKQQVRNSDIQVKNARLSGPNLLRPVFANEVTMHLHLTTTQYIHECCPHPVPPTYLAYAAANAVALPIGRLAARLTLPHI
jgi:hypothetical protein